ncbi:protein translocase subunit SecF [Marmoricola endophyticus]|uniref:Protein-export membrane protein SecF n=1 Tax=Marmoricola endophyticus TaxID=2040280 RepID=A0A917BBX4_9ACTN|nr:protein translocase subunit SecF [Marmoricola endophyticus]GGF36162.1 protein translocase subunit SecF [Marmoricola endophyticus]
MGTFSRLGNDLYEGRRSIDFVGRRRTWYVISGVLAVLAILGLTVKGLNLGIEFEGGTEYTVSVPSSAVTQGNADKISDAIKALDIEKANNVTTNTSGDSSIKAQTENLTEAQSDQVREAMAGAVGAQTSAVSENTVGPSYGSQVTRQAATGLVVFLILVLLFIWAYFREWKMSVAAIVALAHDVFITAGIYALSGFEVTPATVTGLLTILGFSLYDTVVVFDKVRENTRRLRQGRATYAQAANLAVNQTLVRSINTTVVALLPVGAILVVGIFTLGSGSLKDLALSLFIGMAVGAYSSIFIATPLLAHMKSGEKAVTEADRRARARAKRDADRYADVPSFSEGMALSDPEDRDPTDDVEHDAEPGDRPVATLRRPTDRSAEATGSGRVVPESKGPVSESRASGRNQPSRQPRSKRPKP